jgi:cytochrome b
MTTTEPRPRTVRVWDAAVRIFHWSLVTAFAIAWVTGDEMETAHEAAGYVILGLIAFRLVWGLAGSPYARFTQFLRGPAAVASYLGAMLSGRERRHLGHNPAGGAMILALLATLATAGATGWMMTLDAFHGVEWIEEVHEAIANLLLVLVGLHVAGVVFASLRHRENLVRAMFDGRKREPAPGDVA